jgi:mannose-6-phosphate isomerase-like protein (cupin superfamily)
MYSIVCERLHRAAPKELDMRKRLTWLVLFSSVITVTVLYYAVRAWATAASGYTSSTLYKGTFSPIDVSNQFIPTPGDIWLSTQKTTAPSDLYVQQNTWQPGGTTGWHTHPGHSLIIVTQGTVTAYDGHDPNCTPEVYTQGMTFVDPGGHHVHIIRNETSAVAQTIAIQLILAGAARRIDASDPGNCPF